MKTCNWWQRGALALGCTGVMLLAGGCGRGASHTDPPTDRSPDLARLLAGSWRAHDDSVEFHVARLPEFARAYYVEELEPANPHEPLRQFVWMLYQDGPDTVAEHWRLTRTADFVNAWQDPEALENPLFSMYYLRHEPDCDVVFRERDGRFVGMSAGGACDGGYADVADYARRIEVEPGTLRYAATYTDADDSPREHDRRFHRIAR